MKKFYGKIFRWAHPLVHIGGATTSDGTLLWPSTRYPRPFSDRRSSGQEVVLSCDYSNSHRFVAEILLWTALLCYVSYFGSITDVVVADSYLQRIYLLIEGCR